MGVKACTKGEVNPGAAAPQPPNILMRIAPITVGLLSLVPLFAACNSTPAETEHKAFVSAEMEPYTCGTIKNLHTMGGFFLASQPAPEDFEQAAMGGIKTVVNFRKDAEITTFDEALVVGNNGMEYVHIPWNGPDELTDEIFDRSREMFNTVERPALVHCGSSNRVGAVWLAWRVLDEGATVEDALAEAKMAGLKTPAYEEKALDYIRRHQAM